MSTHQPNDWNYPTQVRFGAGRVAELAAACTATGMRNPLLVMDAGLATGAVATAVRAGLGGLVQTAYHDFRSNPTGEDVARGVAQLRRGGHDGVVAVGGGSALDTGKAIAFMAVQQRPLWDFEDVGDNWRLAETDGIPPIIAVPTTAGTGAEVGRAGVFHREQDDTKRIIFHPAMLPRIALLDPELTLGLPPAMTAGTGMDALAHCLEAYCSPRYHPMADGIAMEGMRLVREYLPRAYHRGDDLEARAHMLSAALAGATAFQKGLGAIHSLSHPVGALFDTHHGTTNATVMPYVLVCNRGAIEPRIERLARYLGIGGGFDGFLAWILELRGELAIPHTLAELGVDAAQATRLAPLALADPSTATNPLPLDVAAFTRLYDNCIQGTL